MRVLALVNLPKLILEGMMKHTATSTYEGYIVRFYNVILSRCHIMGTPCSKDSYLDLQPTQQISNYLKLSVESR